MRSSRFAVALLCLLLPLVLASCGRKMGENSPSSALPPINKESSTYSEALPENTSESEGTEDPWTNTCWQAVRYIVTEEGQTMEGTLPEDDWVITKAKALHLDNFTPAVRITTRTDVQCAP